MVDIGCANGLAIPLFIGIGCKLKYEGVDISSELLKIAKSRYPNFRFCKSSILEESTLPKKKYAGFWAAATLQHIPKPDWPLMLGNIEKIIKTGGIGYVSLPEQRLGISSGVDTRHFSLFTKKEFANLIYQRKWTILKTGFLPGTQRSAVWRWFIVQLP